jgi:hypothetical protein
VTNIDAVLDALHEHDVRFIIIGGVAATAHGSARVTYDLDMLYARDAANIERLIAALSPFHPYLRGAPPGLPFAWDARTVTAGLNFTLTTTLGSVDFLGEVAGIGSYEDAAPHASAMVLDGKHESLVLDLDWLIRSKRAAGRPKDLEVLAELELLRDLGSEGR